LACWTGKPIGTEKLEPQEDTLGLKVGVMNVAIPPLNLNRGYLLPLDRVPVLRFKASTGPIRRVRWNPRYPFQFSTCSPVCKLLTKRYCSTQSIPFHPRQETCRSGTRQTLPRPFARMAVRRSLEWIGLVPAPV